MPWGEDDYACPATTWRDYPDTMHLLYDTIAHYQNGFLPTSGGILDQPWLLMKALVIVSSEQQECETARKEAETERERWRAAQSQGGRQ